MFQAHPAYRAQIAALRTVFGDRVLPIFPDDRVEHERWMRQPRALHYWERIKALRVDDRESVCYVSGTLRPFMYRLLDRFDISYLDIDDPLSLYSNGSRTFLPGPKFRQCAKSILKRMDRTRLSFWSDIQLRSFVANLLPEESAELLESERLAVLPPAILPNVEKTSVGGGSRLRCLAIASGKFWHKGIPDAIAAVDRVASEGLPITLTLIGAGLPPEWRTFISSKKHLEFHEQISRERLDQIFRSHDLLVFPSHHDTYGWVVLEAKSYGLPSLVTDFYSRPEIVIHGGDGIVVSDPFSSPFLPISPIAYAEGHIDITVGNVLRVSRLLDGYIEQLADSLRQLINSAGLIGDLGARALAAVQPSAHFGVERRVERIAKTLAL